MTSWTVRIFSASSSEISMSYSSSRAITSSTMSSESAPRSSMKDACGVTWSSLTPSCSQMISLTRCSTLAAIPFLLESHVQAAVHVEDVPGHVSCLWRGEKSHRRRHVVHPPEPPGGDERRVGRALWLRQRRRHFRLDEP